MSKENIALFYEKVKDDQGLQEIIKGLAGKSQEEVIGAVVKLGGENGFHFTAEDLKAYAEEKAAEHNQSGELDDSQLEAVAGGGSAEMTAFVSLITFGIGCAVSLGQGKNCFIK